MVVAALVAALVAVPEAGATFPGENGKIAFVGAGALHRGIWSMSPDGSGLTQLSTGDDADPAWSADGQRLLYSSVVPCACQSFPDVFAMQADGSGKTPLTTDPAADWEPAWSPDGSRVAFVSARGGRHLMWLMNADGSGQSPFVYGEEPSWSPDGKTIAFTPAAGAVGTVSPDGSGLRTVAPQTFPSPTSPDWSPDGRRLVFGEIVDPGDNLTPPTWDLLTVNADGSGQTRLHLEALAPHSPKWSPDGSQIVFAGKGHIYVANPDGSSPHQVGSAEGFQPDWQPVPLPSRKQQCVNGGWRRYPRFENQGECVAFVRHQARAVCLIERASLGRPAFRSKHGVPHALRRCIAQALG